MLHLTKHDAAGNDFLVRIVQPTDEPLGGGEIRQLCDRHRGVGADGVIEVGRGHNGAELAMVLHNADGGPAEMSGNGIRCLAQAAVDGGLVAPGWFSVATDAGRRAVEYRSQSTGRAWASVEMGPVRLGEAQVEAQTGRPARQVSVGNPHLVVLFERSDELAIEELGPKIQAALPGQAVNVELIAPGPDPDQLTLTVFERGAGITMACGTGSCAAAAAARAWGLVGDTVVVANPGGQLEVQLRDGAVTEAVLGGPVRRVAEVLVDRRLLS